VVAAASPAWGAALDGAGASWAHPAIARTTAKEAVTAILCVDMNLPIRLVGPAKQRPL